MTLSGSDISRREAILESRVQGETSTSVRLCVSVVSHGQGDMVLSLLNDIERYCDTSTIAVVLTVNVPESVVVDPERFSFPLRVISNLAPKGFGENHNFAFSRASQQWRFELFCVVNPDVRLTDDVFTKLVQQGAELEKYGVIAPLVTDPRGEIQDSARKLPTPLVIAKKAFFRRFSCDYEVKMELLFPEWVAGMFMLFPFETYRRIGGFDEKFFLYYEDVDLCCRLRLNGYRVVVDPKARVVHDARRSSHRRMRYLMWHLKSVTRFFMSSVFLRALLLRRVRADEQG